MKEYKPTGYDLYLKDLYHSNSAFKYYCDYYKGAPINRFSYLDEFVDWVNGGEYKKHYSNSHRKRCEGWIASAKDVESYMDALKVSVEDAFELWYFNRWVGYDKCKLTKMQIKRLIKYNFSTGAIVRSYMDEHPKATKSSIVRSTALSPRTVSKWFYIVKREENLEVFVNYAYQEHRKACEIWQEGEPVKSWRDKETHSTCIEYESGKLWHYQFDAWYKIIWW